jgi:tripartite-type tricarboxylate transporter receptor subunit TctC
MHLPWRAVVVLAAVLIADEAIAQANYPEKPIRMLAGFPAGGPSDIVARLVGDRLTDALGKPVVVEVMTGAGGTIATDRVVKSAPDGYTLLMATSGMIVVNPSLYPRLPFDPLKDLTPVIEISVQPNFLVVNNSVPANSVQELVALARAQPGKLSFASGGAGTSNHLAGELFKSMAGVDIVHVPYRGNSAIMADLFAGRVAIMFDGPPTQLGNIREGKVRALAITTAERSPVLPAVPPVADTLPGYAIPFWTAIFAPASTPKDVVERIAAETGKAMQHPDVLRRYGELGIVGVGSSPQELDRFWRAQLDYLGKIVKDANIKPVD